MLHATRRGFRKPTFQISEAGRRVATFAKGDWRGCEFLVAGQRFQVLHESRTRVTFIGPAGYVATADRGFEGLLWTITSAMGRWEFERLSTGDSAWEVHNGGHPVGAVRRDGAASTPSHADLPGDVPLPLRVFVYYLALYLWEATN